MVEPESGGVRTVVWAEVCPWLSILRSFRIAISLRVLVFGAAGIFLTLAGSWVIGNLFRAGAESAGWQPTVFGQSYFAHSRCPIPIATAVRSTCRVSSVASGMARRAICVHVGRTE